MNKNCQITIIGAGRIGKALGKILQTTGNEVSFWDKNAAQSLDQKNLSEIVPESDFLFLCIPSWAFREAVNSFLSYLNQKTVIVSLTKGIETNSLKTAAEILRELLPPTQPFCILGGPLMAEELNQNLPTVGVASSKEENSARQLKEIFNGSNLFLEINSDVSGTALSGSLKNVYSVALGMADGLNFGLNFKGWLTTQIIKEMAEIIGALGGEKNTAYGVAGLSDLITTGFSQYSRDRQAGEDVIKTKNISQEAEGISSLTPILKILENKNINIPPLLQAIKEIIISGQEPAVAFKKLFS